jgi:putative heme iron utilization protein
VRFFVRRFMQAYDDEADVRGALAQRASNGENAP